MITVAGQEQACIHYRVMNTVPYDLWYDGQERMVRHEWVTPMSPHLGSAPGLPCF
jgi:hypothetical protein